MKTNIKHAILIAFASIFTQLKSQSEANFRLNIYEDSVVVKHIDNFDKISYYDTFGLLQKGKVYFINDSQFCFLDYFLEKSKDTLHINSIKTLPIYNKGKTFGRKYYPASKVLVICLLTSYIGILYFSIREIYLTVKEGRYHTEKYQNRAILASKKKTISFKIEPITTST